MATVQSNDSSRGRNSPNRISDLKSGSVTILQLSDGWRLGARWLVGWVWRVGLRRRVSFSEMRQQVEATGGRQGNGFHLGERMEQSYEENMFDFMCIFSTSSWNIYCNFRNGHYCLRMRVTAHDFMIKTEQILKTDLE